jgi:hypothetical protein
VYRASGKIYFQVAEGDVEYLYRMNDDGTQREKLLPDPIIDLKTVSPDERFAVVRRATKGKTTPLRLRSSRSPADPRFVSAPTGAAFAGPRMGRTSISRGRP